MYTQRGQIEVAERARKTDRGRVKSRGRQQGTKREKERELER